MRSRSRNTRDAYDFVHSNSQKETSASRVIVRICTATDQCKRIVMSTSKAENEKLPAAISCSLKGTHHQKRKIGSNSSTSVLLAIVLNIATFTLF